MPTAVPDNDTNGFLSHEVNPVEQMLRLRVELHGEGPYRLAAVGQKREGLRVLYTLGLQHHAQPLLGFGIVALDEAKVFGWLIGWH
jgi:hypothetical protein